MLRRIFIIGILAFGVSACGESTASPVAPVPALSTVIITDPGMVYDGDVIQLRARPLNAQGGEVSEATMQWSVLDPTVATITTSGLMNALRDGQTDVIVQATANGVTRQQRQRLSVILRPASSLELSRTQLELPLRATGSVAAILRSVDGRVLQGRPLSWTSDDPSIALVDGDGRITALRPGATSVRVRYGTLTGAVQIRVLATTPTPVVTTWDIVAVNGRPVPAVIDDQEVMLPGGPAREISRIESGTVVTDGNGYSVLFPVVTYHRTELMGNIGERVVSRSTVRDRGTVIYDWFTGEGTWSSTDVGGLAHRVTSIDGHVTVFFREPGTSTVWQLRLRQRP
jgi:hypothetical protein